MSEWKRHGRLPTSTLMRPHIPGDSLDGVSISDADVADGYPGMAGSFVAKSDINPDDMWFINADYHRANFEQEPEEDNTEEN